MTVLVTGSTGYIGSSLVEFLNEETDREIAVLCRDLPEYLADWQERFSVYRADVTEQERLHEIIGPEIDQIVHLAAYNDVDTDANPQKALLVNGFGTRAVLDAAAAAGCSNVVYFSTQKVYGYNLQGTFTTQSPLGFQDDYGLTHAVGEQYCQMYSKTTDLATNVVRPSNVFGAPVHPQIDRWTLVPACFCQSIYEDRELRLRSSGRQQRDFVDLEFVAESVERLLTTAQSGYNAYNITSETQLSIYEVAEIVQAAAEDVLDEQVRLVKESDEPKSGNEFLVRNNLLHPPTEAQIRDRLSRESQEMIRMLQIESEPA